MPIISSSTNRFNQTLNLLRLGLDLKYFEIMLYALIMLSTPISLAHAKVRWLWVFGPSEGETCDQERRAFNQALETRITHLTGRTITKDDQKLSCPDLACVRTRMSAAGSTVALYVQSKCFKSALEITSSLVDQDGVSDTEKMRVPLGRMHIAIDKGEKCALRLLRGKVSEEDTPTEQTVYKSISLGAMQAPPGGISSQGPFGGQRLFDGLSTRFGLTWLSQSSLNEWGSHIEAGGIGGRNFNFVFLQIALSYRRYIQRDRVTPFFGFAPFYQLLTGDRTRTTSRIEKEFLTFTTSTTEQPTSTTGVAAEVGVAWLGAALEPTISLEMVLFGDTNSRGPILFAGMRW